MNEALMERTKQRIRDKEGLRLRPYRCSMGKLTIGYGRNLDDRGISIRDAEFMLAGDVGLAISDLKRVFSNLESFSEHRQVALIDMMFNLGLVRFMGFQRMIACISLGDWSGAAYECLESVYAKQTGPRAVEVAQMLREG